MASSESDSIVERAEGSSLAGVIYKLTPVVKLPKWLVSLGADSLGAPAE